MVLFQETCCEIMSHLRLLCLNEQALLVFTTTMEVLAHPKTKTFPMSSLSLLCQ